MGKGLHLAGVSLGIWRGGLAVLGGGGVGGGSLLAGHRLLGLSTFFVKIISCFINMDLVGLEFSSSLLLAPLSIQRKNAPSKHVLYSLLNINNLYRAAG